MFYKTDAHHGLPHNPFKALVAPRPIGWVSTRSASGVSNLAPYSFFNAIGDTPPMVMISSSGYKDTVRNVEETGEFVCNLATMDLAEQMNTSSKMVEAEVNEFELSGLSEVASNIVSAPRLGEAKASLECKRLSVQRLVDLEGKETNSWLILGQVVGVHISDDALVDGLVDMARLRPLARLGYMDYAVINEVFQIERPR
ncbi:flavin reductase family protein [Pseudovibrio sp. SPO723]|uniref:flavin reductase family protein n=1 Tax=Nesiotobacter zosterae TaxID=392721 RepID=UPI0029C41193|nr:flavin reductase family protein [Pseudovibrio sp. SPO723]MDX5594601.1 flavin reductase family protein [Pseudovibrio sp. SPO723]